MLETFDKYSIYNVKKACESLRESNVTITCDAIKMILLKTPDDTDIYDGELDEIELACQRQLNRFNETRCAV